MSEVILATLVHRGGKTGKGFGYRLQESLDEQTSWPAAPLRSPSVLLCERRWSK